MKINRAEFNNNIEVPLRQRQESSNKMILYNIIYTTIIHKPNVLEVIIVLLSAILQLLNRAQAALFSHTQNDIFERE